MEPQVVVYSMQPERELAAESPTRTPASAPPLEPVDVVASLPHTTTTAFNDQVYRHVLAGFDLAGRRAYFSAKREFEQALRITAASFDAQLDSPQHVTLLSDGLVALEEADDFFVDDPRSAGQLQLRNIVVTHRTPLMKDEPAEEMAALEAMQTYYAYAQTQIVTALHHDPLAAEALYGLGKTYAALAADGDRLGRLHGAKALLMHQCALRVAPEHALAANELGVLLARFGRYEDARQVLLQSPPERRIPETWHNLAVVFEHLGERDLAEDAYRRCKLAMQAQDAQEQQRLAAAPASDGVQWVDVSAAAAHQQPVRKTDAEEQRSAWSWPFGGWKR
jgi:tetratricopeptide (TPR) repeat protein